MENKKFGYYIALSTAILTIITFGIAMFAIPVSGPYCPGNCIEYPYIDSIVDRFPHDYYWMFPAMLLSLLFVALFASIHQNTPEEKKVYSLIGFAFALMSSTVLIIDYFIQVSIIQVSLLNGETEGIALWTQYNPHGIFIVLEELGYILMSFSFLAIVPVFREKTRLNKTISWILIISFVLTVISFIYYSMMYGLHREYYFEVVVITIDWLTLIVFGFLFARSIRK